MERSYRRELAAIFWFAAVILGIFYTWDSMYVSFDPDGISYLDMGDAYLRGDWKMAITGYMGSPPLYPWILGTAIFVLKPSTYWEFGVVRMLNFVIFLCAAGCFQFFLKEGASALQNLKARNAGSLTLPIWVWLALGYSLFLWTTLTWIGLSYPGPDLLVAGVVYLASAILLRIRRRPSGSTFAFLGLVVGVGSLLKSVMFPIAMIFLVISVLCVGNLKRGVRLASLSLFVFLLVSGPFFIALSKIQGYPTLGQSGKLNYAWLVNGVQRFHYWQGEPASSGVPKHAVRVTATPGTPTVYEFDGPVGGSYPLWYDASYWNEGVVTHFDLMQQARVLLRNVGYCFRLIFPSHSGLMAGILILILMTTNRWACFESLGEYWPILVPPILVFGMYSLVHVENRYVAAFDVVFWMGVASCVILPDSRESRKLMFAVGASVVFTILLALAYTTSETVFASVHSWRTHEGEPLVDAQTASDLNRRGVLPGYKVAVIGNAFVASKWARLGRIQIIAEAGDYNNSWLNDGLARCNLIRVFARTNAYAIVTESLPNDIPMEGWERVGNTQRFIYFLKGPSIARDRNGQFAGCAA